MFPNKFFYQIKRFKELALDLLFPVSCLSCGREGVWLCFDCAAKLKFCREQTCLICKNKKEIGRFCSACQKNYYLEGILIAGDYNDKIFADLIKNLKYHFTLEIAEILGNFLFNFTQTNPIFAEKIKNFSVIPVPLHQKRRRWRSFNQAEEITKALNAHLGLPILAELVRIKNTKPQVKLNAEERKTNVKDCFSWTGENLKGKNILLIDDVTTTGSTLNECAKALKQAGAGEIWGLVVANG